MRSKKRRTNRLNHFNGGRSRGRGRGRGGGGNRGRGGYNGRNRGQFSGYNFGNQKQQQTFSFPFQRSVPIKNFSQPQRKKTQSKPNSIFPPNAPTQNSGYPMQMRKVKNKHNFHVKNQHENGMKLQHVNGMKRQLVNGMEPFVMFVRKLTEKSFPSFKVIRMEDFVIDPLTLAKEKQVGLYAFVQNNEKKTAGLPLNSEKVDSMKIMKTIWDNTPKYKKKRKMFWYFRCSGKSISKEVGGFDKKLGTTKGVIWSEKKNVIMDYVKKGFVLNVGTNRYQKIEKKNEGIMLETKSSYLVGRMIVVIGKSD